MADDGAEDLLTQFWALFELLDDAERQEVTAQLLASHGPDACIMDEDICDLFGWGIPLRCLPELPVSTLLVDPVGT